MKKNKNRVLKFIILACSLFVGFSSTASAADCTNKLFSVTIDSKLSVGDVIDNLAETCDLTVVLKDEEAKRRLNKKLYYVKLKNSTLRGFLDTILKDNDLHYTLSGNKLKISYLLTRTFRIHYIAGNRVGTSHANVTIANATNSGAANKASGANTSRTGISIESNDEFSFWKNVEQEVQRILISASDGSTHFVKNGEGWVGPDGQIWEYNPLAPIVNPEAGMLTVTGTEKQIKRVARYIHTLTKQLKTQVLVDVRILSVTFNNTNTKGVDWSQLYKLQNFSIGTLQMAQKNIASYSFDQLEGFGDTSYMTGTRPSNASLLHIQGITQVSEIVKFLNTQGDVKSISSPRVMTLNNQPALISVGKELFYKIKSSSTASNSGGSVAAEGEQVDSVFAGILLDITPEIDNSGMITLKINPSISDTLDDVQYSGESGTARSIPPDLTRRQIASVIKVKNGDHAILGGLIFSRRSNEVKKLPLLGDIPIIGNAFKREEKVERVEELVIIVTPHIIKNSKSVSLKDLGYIRVNEK